MGVQTVAGSAVSIRERTRSATSVIVRYAYINIGQYPLPLSVGPRLVWQREVRYLYTFFGQLSPSVESAREPVTPPPFSDLLPSGYHFALSLPFSRHNLRQPRMERPAPHRQAWITLCMAVLPRRVAVGVIRRHELVSRRKPRAPWRLALEGGEQSDEQSQHAGRERYQPSARICNGDRRFRVSGADRTATFTPTCPCASAMACPIRLPAPVTSADLPRNWPRDFGFSLRRTARSRSRVGQLRPRG